MPNATTGRATLQQQGLDCGPAIRSSRSMATGLLHWALAVRSDGQRVLQGTIPTLIGWGAAHPCDHLPPSGVQLKNMVLEHLQADALQAACNSLGLGVVRVRSAGYVRLIARCSTPRGYVEVGSRAQALQA